MTRKQKYLKLTFWLVFAGLSATVSLFSATYLYLSPKLPEVESLRQIKLQTPLRVFSSDGALIGEFGEKRRTPIAIQDTPKAFIQAILAAEDDGFYSHSGVDIKGLLRAASELLTSGQIKTGGSTVTMQVARNFFLTRKQTFSRKFNEILLALQIEKELSKDEILELYVNKIYLGNRAYGIEAAAQVYYGKPISQLNLAQLAMIAGLPKAPSAYNPIVNPSRALIRRNWILGRMLNLGYINAEEYNVAVSAPVTASYHGSRLDLDAPYIAEMARQEAVDRLGEAAYTDGFRVYTTVNAKLQASAQRAVIDGLLTYDQRHGYRGPEAHLKTPQPPPADAAAELPLAQWQQSLRSFSTIAGLRAAVVTQVNPDSVDFMLADGTRSTLLWEHGLSSARPYISENSRGPAPKQAADLFKPGDVIRVSAQPDHWQLSQIPAAQAALVAINPTDGSIQALSGGFDFNQSHFNRAIQAKRQPGSNFKPFIYATALEHGFTPATIVNDAPIVFDDPSLESAWRPENSSGQFAGPTRLRKALYESRNLVSIRVLRSIGIDTAIASMGRFGFDTSSLPRDLSLALGSHAFTPLEVASGYTVFANGGYKVDPYLVQRIESARGQVVYQAQPYTVCRQCEAPAPSAPAGNSQAGMDLQAMAALESAMAAELANAQSPQANGGNSATAAAPTATPTKPPAPRVMSPQVAYLIDDMLRDVITKGTGRKAGVLGRKDLAGKTGTTNGPVDAWFSGYNHHIVATTWLGFDQNLLLGRREFGGTSALPIWIDFMRTALQGVPEKPRSLPNGLTSVRIDPATGMRARASNQRAIFELFQAGDVPEFGTEPAPVFDDMNRSDEDEALPEELF